MCELAQSLIAVQQLSLRDVDVEVVDITESDTLFERYGVAIPVLQHPDRRELNWPFGAHQLQHFLSS